MEMAKYLISCCLLLSLMSLSSSISQQQSCVGSYNSSQGISLLERSFHEGARLLEVSRVNTSLACLGQCCSIQDCDLAVLEEGEAGGAYTCILVKCFSGHKPVCTFGPRAGYQSHSRSFSLHRKVDPTATPPVDCSSPALTGPCRAAFPRWNYDASRKTCEEFTYGGCLGNGNNFVSKEDCLKVCDRVAVNAVPVSLRSTQSLKDCSRPCSVSEFQCADGCCVSRNLLCDGTSRCFDKSDEIYCNAVYASYTRLIGRQESGPQGNEQCNAPKEVGKCRAAFPRWYFDTQTQSCKKFTYGGCKGNKNNYESEGECLATCTGHKEIIPEPHKLQGKAGDEESCYAPVVTGKCRAAFPRWYYDLDSQRCQRFTYGGCGGNKNNYETEAECLAMCSGKTAILMVVLLSICILVLLVGVIYFIVRLTRTDHIVSYQRAPRGEDKETLINTVQNL
ncbi:actinia tenebrosa protease inhibitors-like isoform X2 [Mustelus asterias]